MGYIESEIGSDLVIWSKMITPIVIYQPQSTPTERPITGGGDHQYFPNEPSAGPSGEPTISPSEEPTNSLPDFKDIRGHWAEKEIEDLAEQGIIKGVTEEEFMPDRSISRAEFTALIVRTLGLEKVEYEDAFDDVKGSDWYADDIQTALANGIISADSQFRPLEPISREEIAKVMVEALMHQLNTDQLEKGDVSSFTDRDQISAWAQEYVEMALGCGLMQGVSKTEFAPRENATRAQTAVLLWRFLNNLDEGKAE